MSRSAPGHVYGVLVVAVLAISSSAVMVRAIGAVPPVTIAFWRTVFVAALLAPLVRRITLRDAGLIALAGAFLAAHFTTWFASLDHIPVMRSTVLVCLNPLWAGLIEWTILRRRPRARFWTGLAIALPGVVLLTDARIGGASLTGDLLALVGGILGAAYLVVGRSVRARVGIGTYASLVCAAAAVWLTPVVIARDAPLVGFEWTTWALFAGLALGPQLLGHNGLNYTLRWLPAATVSSVTILEPVGAAVLAAAFLGEVPGPWAAVGALLTILGVLVATWQRRKRPPAEPAA